MLESKTEVMARANELKNLVANRLLCILQIAIRPNNIIV